MRKLIIAALAASTLLAAAPAAAQNFSGPRVGVTVGTGGEDIADFDGATIGLEAGYDFDLGNVVAGVGVEYQTDLGEDFLDLNETALLARLGVKAGDSALIYVSGGYTRLNDGASPFDGLVDGYRVGVGGEIAIGTNTSLKVEQRYLNYDGADVFQTVAGLGVRF